VVRARHEPRATRAGLRRGDVTVRVDDKEVRSYQDMLKDAGPSAGEDVSLRVRRGTRESQELIVSR